MKKQLIESIIKDADTSHKRINRVANGKSVDDARLALVNEILALGQSLVQLEAVDPELSDLSLELGEQPDKGPMLLARYAMKLAREVGNGSLTQVQVASTISAIDVIPSIKMS